MKASTLNSLCILCFICSSPATLAVSSDKENEVKPVKCSNKLSDHPYVVSVLDNNKNWLSGAVFVSSIWALTALNSKEKVSAKEAMVLYGTHDKESFSSNHSESVSKVVYYPWKNENHHRYHLALIQVAKAIDFGNASFAKLPKDKAATKNCQRVKAVGWQTSSGMQDKTGNGERRCDEGKRKKKTKKGGTCGGANFAIFLCSIEDDIGFCFYDYPQVNLWDSLGAAILCADGTEDVLVGITTGGGMAEAVGQFTKWISDTVGLPVAYKEDPFIEKGSTSASAKVDDYNVLVETVVILVVSSVSIGLWQSILVN